MECDVTTINYSSSVDTDIEHGGGEKVEITEAFILYITLVFGAIFFTSVFGNAIVILGIYYEPSLQVVRNYFVASLALADFLTGLIAVPTTVVYYLFYRRSFQISTENGFAEGASLYTIPLFYFIWASIHNLLLITFDRFVAVNWPLTYGLKLSPRRAFCLIGMCWLVSWYPCIIPFFWDLEKSDFGVRFDLFGNKVRNYICMVYFTCVMIIIITLHLKTYSIARQQNKKISGRQQLDVNNTNQIGSRNPSHIFQRGTMKLYWEIHQKAFKTTSLVLSVFVVTLFPLVVTTSISYSNGCVVTEIAWISEVAMFCSSSINPFIYAFMRQDFNAAFRKLFGCRRTTNVYERPIVV
ncbi:adenosine receptor A3-like [Antedon mediterranea]|uniref:adenosine receptor A3-like n=1 Tax=Antedon mediterranea TaxID=105859 RepID=UPI003AF8E2D5